MLLGYNVYNTLIVVGKVGNGKSSLLSSILCEMNKLSGSLHVNGSVSFVSQQAWLQNETVKNNILFGRDLDQCRYNKIISACALDTDLNVLPAGDLTEIGEKVRLNKFNS